MNWILIPIALGIWAGLYSFFYLTKDAKTRLEMIDDITHGRYYRGANPKYKYIEEANRKDD